MDDEMQIVSRQLGRPLICPMTVQARCAGGYPVVVKNAPADFQGSPFPTLYWLTCPALRTEISRLEAAGTLSIMADFIQADEAARAGLIASDRAYRRARSRLAAGLASDKPDLGIGGSRDPLMLKCLHAHAADYLAAGLNPVGKDVVARTSVAADCRLCADL